MKVMKSLSLMSLGAGMVLLYQKYNTAIMDAMKEKIACACNEIDDML